MATIFEIEQTEGGEVLKMKGDHLYSYVTFKYCANPYCSCGHCQFEFKAKKDEDKKANPIFLDVDVIEGKFQELEPDIATNENYIETINCKVYLEENLSTEDWELLRAYHYMLKEYDIETQEGIDEDYTCYFTKKHLDTPSLQIAYQDVFPFCRLFKVVKEGVEYTILDMYCKNPDCDCRKMNLQLFQGDTYIEEFVYDYWNDDLDDNTYRWVVEQLNEQQPIKLYFYKRNLEIESAYAKAMSEHLEEEYKRLKTLVKTSVKVGRNDTCPCGSGKKYKRCCLNKSN